jgi:NADH-quinone oxidoreductase subunit J
LSYRHVDTDDILSLLVEYGIDGYRRLPGLPVTYDEFALSLAYGYHRVDGLQSRLKRLEHGLPREYAGSGKLDFTGLLRAYLAFAVYVLIILGGGFMAILCRNLVRAMMGLVLTFLGVAGMYLLLASPFLAFMQLLIYVGAVCVLIFFAIMLTRNTNDGQEAKLPSITSVIMGLLVFALPLAVLAPLIIKYAPDLPQVSYGQTETRLLGEGLITTDVLSFELISIILLVAMSGAVFLAWRRRSEGK